MAAAQESPGAAAIKNLVAGTAAGMFAKTVGAEVALAALTIAEYPFDTVKVRLQSMPWKYTGVGQCFKLSFAEHGFLGFYKGLASPLIGCAIETALMFSSYGEARRWLEPYGTAISVAGGGAVSGFLSTLINTPLELIKCRMQAQPQDYRSTVECFRKTLHKEGIRGLTTGFWATFMREVPGTAMWFGAYETVMHHATPPGRPRSEAPVWAPFAAGAAAGAIFWMVPFPFDVLKSRVQTYATGKSYAEVVREVYKEAGIGGFYRGMGITVARAMPSNAIIFSTYVYVRAILDLIEKRFS